MPPEAIAKQRCGYVFHIEHRVEPEDIAYDTGQRQDRVFDKDGRLVVVVSDETMYGEPRGFPVRLQFDYDAMGRVKRWRRGSAQTDLYSDGDVVEFTYNPDGSFSTDVTSNSPQVMTRGGPLEPSGGFCQRLDFDDAGRLLRESWGCEGLKEGRVYSYDDRGRLTLVVGHGLFDLFGPFGRDDRFGEPNEWTIRLEYTSDTEVVIRWNEIEVRTEEMAELKQRLVRTFDGNGLAIRERFDAHDDGSFDEETLYTYENGKLLKQTRDLALDGLVDVIEEHTRTGMTEHVERRNSLQQGDDAVYWYSLGHFGASPRSLQDGTHSASLDTLVLLDGRHVATSLQSQALWDFSYDAQGRLLTGALEARAVDFTVPPPNMTTVASSVKQRWNPAGYVDLVELTQMRVTMNRQSLPGSLTAKTECSVTSACASGEVVLPAEASLIACQPSVLLAHADQIVVEPAFEPPYQLPPFDRIEAFKRRQHYAMHFNFDFASMREIIGY